MPALSTLILAAGKGTRMKSALPKVMHPVGGVPMIERVCATAKASRSAATAVIVGHGSEVVRAHLSARFSNLRYFKQNKLDGSGGAVRQAAAWLRSISGDVLITCGDAPLFTAATFRGLVTRHRRERNDATVLTMKVPDPAGYGRIIRDGSRAVLGIVEELDATTAQRRVDEVNTGTYVFRAAVLARHIKRLKNDNAKREYYLTDVLGLIRDAGGRVGGSLCDDYREAQGINSRIDLAAANRALYQRTAETLMRAGVTIVDPASTFIDEAAKVAPDAVIWPQTFVLGESRIGKAAQVGPWSHLQDAIVEEKSYVLASFVEKARIRAGAKVGPMSRVRPNSVVGPGAHVGNFSELKNTALGAGTKVNHLSYLGDSTVGKNVNIGAGTITCNYDGYRKFPTVIQDQAFIGSNANLIAPIRIGAHAVVGAGSSLSEDVPAWSLAVERSRPAVKRGWAKKRRRNTANRK